MDIFKEKPKLIGLECESATKRIFAFRIRFFVRYTQQQQQLQEQLKAKCKINITPATTQLPWGTVRGATGERRRC